MRVGLSDKQLADMYSHCLRSISIPIRNRLVGLSSIASQYPIIRSLCDGVILSLNVACRLNVPQHLQSHPIRFIFMLASGLSLKRLKSARGVTSGIPVPHPAEFRLQGVADC